MSRTILGRVLVVDDELQLLDTLVEALNSQGYAAQGFPTGVEAIEALQQQEFDLLLTDLMMPEMDGITLLKACAAIDQNLVGIVMTGQGTVPTAVEAMKTGAFDYVLKPFRMEVLHPVLKRAMEVRQLRLENIQLRETIAIYNLSQTIALSLDSKLVLENTAEAALQQLDADEVSVMLLAQDKPELVIASMRGGEREHLLGQRSSLQEGIAGWVARQAELLMLNGEVSDSRFAPLRPRPEIGSAISMPMMTAGKLLGVLNVNRLGPRRPFTPGQVKALSILTGAAAAALENESLYHALEAREERFRALIENSADAIALLGADGTILFESPAATRILGYQAEEMVGHNAFEYLHPDDADSSAQVFGSILKTPGEAARGVFRYHHKDDSYRWVEAIGTNLLHEASVKAIVVNYRDITERKQAEEAVLESERQMRALVTSLDDIVLEFDEQGTYLNVWAADESLLAQPKAQMLGKTIEEILGEENARPFTEAVKRVLAGGHSETIEYPLEVIGGQRWFVARINPILAQYGSYRTASMLIRDITERKGAEEQLRYQALLLEHVSDMIVSTDMNGLIRSWNKAAEKVLGYTEAEVLGQHGAGIVRVEYLTTSREKAIAEIQEKGRWEGEVRVQSRDGRLFHMLNSTSVIRNSRGKPVGFVSMTHDITERKRAEEALRESETRFRSLVENSSDEVSIVNADGKLIYESPTANPTLGYQTGEFLGQDLFQLIHPDDVERVQEQLARLMQDTNLNPRDQFRLRHRNGNWRWVEAVGTNLLSEPSVRGIVINYHDVTERVRAEREIQQRNEDLLILNTLNEAANRGEDITSIVEAFAHETRNAFACHDVAIYLLSPDAKYIEMQNSTLPRRVTERIEKLIGRPIPKIQIPVKENGYFTRIMANEQGLITSDPQAIQGWIEEFTETTFLPAIVRPVIRKIVPQIFKTLNIGSTISIPLISSGRTIGILDMSSEGQFTEEDLRRIRSISYQMTAVLMRKQAEKQVQLQLKRLSALSEIDRAISSSLDMRLSLDILLSEVLSQLGVDAAAVLLLNESNLALDYYAGKGFRSLAVRQSRMRLGDGFAGQAGLERKLVHVPNLGELNSNFARADLLKDEGFVEYFGVPLVAKGLLKGVLEIFHRAPLHPDIEWTNYLETLSGQAAIAIDNAQLFEGMQKSNLELIAAYDATIAGWSRAMDLRDEETEGHTQRVTELTQKLAEKMGFSQQEQVQIRRGALLHDIGKLGVPDHILRKPGKLTDEEWVTMRQHPTYALEMLSSIAYLRPALDIPYCHHEKWDGTGYPRGLKGEQIPLPARLFAVVDVWDALTSNRPYRLAWTREETLEYIKEQSGQHFDPGVVDIFLNAIDANGGTPSTEYSL